MAENARMAIDIPGVDFSALARQAIAEKLTEALVGADDAVRKLVVHALVTKVDDQGRASNYSNAVPYVEWVAGDLIRSAARAALIKKVEELRPAVEAALEAELKKSIKPAARALANAFVESSKSSWNLTVNVAFSEARRQ